MCIVTRLAVWIIVTAAILASSFSLHAVGATEPAAVDCIIGGVPKAQHEAEANNAHEEGDQITEWALREALSSC
jgi:hypothetical protein